jgi:hypothetical protein
MAGDSPVAVQDGGSGPPTREFATKLAARASQPPSAAHAIGGVRHGDHMEEQKSTQGTREMKSIWTMVERGDQGKSFWTRVGAGFVNRDGSITIKLDAIPVNGTLQVREWQDPRDRRPDVPEAPRLRAKATPAGDSLL